LLTPRPEVRNRAYELLGASNARQFASAVEKHINRYLEVARGEMNDRRSILEIRKERDAAKALMNSFIHQTVRIKSGNIPKPQTWAIRIQCDFYWCSLVHKTRVQVSGDQVVPDSLCSRLNSVTQSTDLMPLTSANSSQQLFLNNACISQRKSGSEMDFTDTGDNGKGEFSDSVSKDSADDFSSSDHQRYSESNETNDFSQPGTENGEFSCTETTRKEISIERVYDAMVPLVHNQASNNNLFF
uniref:RANB9 n=1 Tax=Anisakis simplex TaxID=6269 RepID=A0A0M3KDV5_ANISI